jgi:hypothetical protein
VRQVTLYSYPAGVAGFGTVGDPNPPHESIDATLRPSEPFRIDVLAVPGTKVRIVVTEKEKTVATEHDIFGAPRADAKVHERAIEEYSFLWFGRHGMREDNADRVTKLFQAIDPAFVVYGIEERQQCKLLRGEPVLLLRAHGIIIHANGDIEDCDFREGDRIDDYLSPKRPTTLAWPAVMQPQTDENEIVWHDEDFLTRAATDKVVIAYKAVKERTGKCYSRMKEKLDPSGTADNIDIVTYQGNKVSKVENAGDRIFNQIDRACGLDALAKQRAAVFKHLAKEFEKAERVRLDAIAKHFNG